MQVEIEEWRDIKGYEGRYQVSNLGNFVSITKRSGRKDLSGSYDKKGYLKITLYKSGDRKTFAAHRLVAAAFIANPNNKPQINHINGNRSQNSIDNLEWCTNAENQWHKFHVLGYTIPKKQLDALHAKTRVLLPQSSRKPIECVETGEIFLSIKEAVRKFGTSQSNFSLVLKGKNKTAAGYHWRYVDGD